MYRDHQFAAACRTKQVQREHSPEIPWALQRLYAARQARIWAAVAGLAGFLALLVDVMLGARHLTHILAASWSVIPLASCVGWLAAGASFRRQAPVLSGDPLLDLIYLERGGARAYATRRVQRLEKPSLVLPVVCLTLIAPLSLHLAVGVGLLGVSVAQFNSWILLSLVLVGHAHAALIIFAVRHVALVQRALERGTDVAGASRGAQALVWTVAIASVPGALLLFVPPVLVAATGALFVPAMFHWAARRAQAERQALASLGPCALAKVTRPAS